MPKAEEWTLKRFSHCVHTLTRGLHIITPLTEKTGRKLTLREVVSDIPPQDMIILDNATVNTDGLVFYQVIDAPKADYELRLGTRDDQLSDDQPAIGDRFDGARRYFVEAR